MTSKHYTADWWYRIIDDMLQGRFNSAVRQLGSIESYLRNLLERAESTDEARGSFDEALAQVINEWHVETGINSFKSAILLEILNAFKIPAGKNKILTLLTLNVDVFDNEIEILRGQKPTNIRLRGLVIIKNYFSFPNSSNTHDTAYQRYIDILVEHTKVPGCVLESVERLLFHGAANRAHGIISVMSESDLADIIRWVFLTGISEVHLTRLLSDLATIVNYSAFASALMVNESLLTKEVVINVLNNIEQPEIGVARRTRSLQKTFGQTAPEQLDEINPLVLLVPQILEPERFGIAALNGLGIEKTITELSNESNLEKLARESDSTQPWLGKLPDTIVENN